MPAGAIVMGHHHKGDCTNVLVKGSLQVYVNGDIQTLTAPLTFTSGPGRKIARILDDVIWLNVFATEETDIDKLEADLIDKSAAFIEHEAMKALTGEVRK